MAIRTSAKPPGRSERAVATRQRIVEATCRLMSARGYTQTTMADIAKEAGVAVQTVYFSFHTKPALMRAAFEYAVHGDHLPLSPAQRPWFMAMSSEPDSHLALEMFVDADIEILRRVLPLVSSFNAMGGDPEVARFYAFSERLRREGFRKVVDVLAEKRPLRRGLDADDATSVLMLLAGADVYRSMLVDNRWPEGKWRSWVIQTLSEALFGA